jgi:hypothetical protein
MPGAVGVSDTVIKFKLGERKLTLTYRKIPFMAWAELKRGPGFTQRTLVTALDDLDVEAVAALIWLERVQRERRLSYADVIGELTNADGDPPEFELTDFIVKGKSMMGRRMTTEEDGTIKIEAARADREGEGDEDPTSGS